VQYEEVLHACITNGPKAVEMPVAPRYAAACLQRKPSSMGAPTNGPLVRLEAVAQLRCRDWCKVRMLAAQTLRTH